MAVRFDQDGESYTRATGLGTITDWTVTCWVKLAIDRAATTVVWQIDDSSGGSYLRLNAWNGTALTFQTTASSWFGLMGHSLVVGEWTFVGLSATANPGQARVRVRTAGSTSWVGGSPAQSNVTISAATLRIGDGVASSEWLNGSVAAVKVWNAALTMDELELESWTYMPCRTSGLAAWYPLLIPGTTDYSGGGQTLSGGAVASTDDGPPISWSTGRHRIVIPAAAAGPVSGTLAGTLPAATASTAGTVTVSGTLAGVAPAAAADLAANINTNVLVGVLPAATASMAGTVEVSGSMAGLLPAAMAAMVGDVEIPTNDIPTVPGIPVRGWAAGSPSRGWAAGAPARGWKTGDPTT